MSRSAVTALLSAALLAPALSLADDVDSFGDYDSDLEFRFYDNSAYGQLRRMRSLRLFTLANSGKSRWFIGVNSDGIIGVHYRASRRFFDDEYPLLLRQRPIRYPLLDVY